MRKYLLLAMVLLETLSINNGETTIFKVLDKTEGKLIYVATSQDGMGGTTTALGVVNKELLK